MLGLITGSGFYNLDALHDAETVTVDSPYGAVSLTRGLWNGGVEVLFLPRHGSEHSIVPHAINYRANIWALKHMGATAIVAVAVSGAISSAMKPGDFVVIDDFIDFTTGRIGTFFDAPGQVVHTEMGDPYDADLRSSIVEAAESARVPLVVGGTYCTSSGPRFETKAEITMMGRLGGDLVGMTGCPEVILANELEIPYAAIGLISNMAAGLGRREFTLDDIRKVLADARWPLEMLLNAIIQNWHP